MQILLDIDGVLVTTPSWRAPEIMADGFMKFDERATSNFRRLIIETGAEIVLTTTHRVNYSAEAWKAIFKFRDIPVSIISKINDKTSVWDIGDRATELINWADTNTKPNFVIIDDDPSLHGLPAILKERCVMTKPLIGLDEEGVVNALRILKTGYQGFSA